MVIPIFLADKAALKPLLCSVADIEIPTKSGLNDFRKYVNECRLSCNISTIFTSSTRSSIEAARYSTPIGIKAKANPIPVLPLGLTNKILLKIAFTPKIRFVLDG